MIVTALLFLLIVGGTNGQQQQMYPTEREALLKLRDSMSSDVNLHWRWTGPPCIRNQSRWLGVSCSNGHVIGINLDGIQLTGILPPSFLQNITMLITLNLSNNSIFGSLPNLTHLLHLENVDLSNNRFTGPIPHHYIRLQRLTIMELQQNYLNGHIPPLNQQTLTNFNVSYNSLDGPIPQTQVLKRFPISSYQHNSGLCGRPLNVTCPPPPPPPSGEGNKKRLGKWSLILIAAASAGLVLLFLVMVLVCVCCYKNRHKKAKAEKRHTGRLVPVLFLQLTVGIFNLNRPNNFPFLWVENFLIQLNPNPTIVCTSL